MRGSAETLEVLLEEARGLRQRPAHLESVEAECQRTKQELDELRRTAAEAAQARDNALHAWRESEQQYYELTEGLPQLVWMCRPDGWNIYFNQRWVEYTGRTLEESYGHGWNLAFHPDDQKRAWECWMHATECGEPFDIEYRFRRADGSYRWMLGRGLPLATRPAGSSSGLGRAPTSAIKRRPRNPCGKPTRNSSKPSGSRASSWPTCRTSSGRL